MDQTRRDFMKSATALGVVAILPPIPAAAAPVAKAYTHQTIAMGYSLTDSQMTEMPGIKEQMNELLQKSIANTEELWRARGKKIMWREEPEITEEREFSRPATSVMLYARGTVVDAAEAEQIETELAQADEEIQGFGLAPVKTEGAAVV